MISFSGVVYLHKKHVTHRDLIKPANIILVSREPMRIKMTDFGLAVERSDQLTSHCGSLPYLAPEVHGKSHSNKVDMWSVGVIAFELAEGLPDYPGGKHRDWPGLLQGKLNAAPLDPLFYRFIKPLPHLLADRRPSARQSPQDRTLQIESQFLDAAGSPTEYLCTDPSRVSYSVRLFLQTATEQRDLLAPPVCEHAQLVGQGSRPDPDLCTSP